MVYTPIEDIRRLDHDRSSFPVRDVPADKSEFSVDIFPDNLVFVGAINTETLRQSILIRNDGYADLIINDVIIVGPYALKSSKPTKLFVNTTTVLEVTFTSKFGGTQTGGLYLVAPNAVGRTFISFSGSSPA